MIRPMRLILKSAVIWAGLGQIPILAGTMQSGAINFTGNVPADFPVSTDPDSTVIKISDKNGAADVTQAPWMTEQGKVNGWDFSDLYLSYDKSSDTMYVGIDFKGVAGDADGNGVRGTSTDQFKATGGWEYENFGGRETITVGFGPNVDGGQPTTVAGIPFYKGQSGPGLYGFNVAKAIPNQSISTNYGETLADNVGTLYNNGPDFEFTVKNFSKLPGIDLSKGLGVSVFAGSQDDVVNGEDLLPYYTINSLNPNIVVPEPATILAWTIGIAAIGLQARRRSRIPIE